LGELFERIKSFKKNKWENICSKMDSRMEGMRKLWDIPSEPNFEKEMLKIVKEVDSGKRSKTEKKKIKKLINESNRLKDLFNEKFLNITFIMENL
jgi:hypothetical protein